jgi:signal transduction histidine kinase
MSLVRNVTVAAVAAMLMAGAAVAGERGTPEEAKALAEKAAQHMREVGAEKAMADFEDPAAGYIDRDLFVVCYSPDAKVICAHGVPALRGRDANAFKDADGKEFGKAIISLAKDSGSGWVEYRMTNPISKKVEAKASYVLQAGDYVVFVGAYKP